MVITNKYIPFNGYSVINLFGILFHRKGTPYPDEIVLNHEHIHTAQMKELLYVFFYILYLIEFIINLIKFKDVYVAYRQISFEKEAYDFQLDQKYLKRRVRFAQFFLY